MARALVRKRDLELLYENDQLNLQMVAGLVFPYYSEARITFLPTYRFDIGSDDYDTSEKARIPAWTDRILRKGTNLRQILYDCAPLRFSDHRPVHAVFECRVSVVDEAKRESISQELYSQRKSELGALAGAGPGSGVLLPQQLSGANGGDDDNDDDEDLIGYDAVEPGLPPASSDRSKWWLENRQAARAQVPVPTGRDGQPMVLNPNRPSNPFGHSEEQDWISVSRSSSRASLSSLSSSPYEKVALPNMTNSSAAATMPRKQQYQQQQQHQQDTGGSGNGSLAARTGRMSLADTPPPPPPPRRTGTGSTTSSIQTGGVPMPGMQQNMSMSMGMGMGMAPLEPTRSASQSPASFSTNATSPPPAATKSGPPPVARKPAHLVTSPTGTGVAAAAAPPRRAAGQGTVDLLDSLDEGGKDMGGWETLQPSMR